MDQTILEVQDLRIHFELREGTVKALNGIDLVLKEGRTLGLVGETGAGKTTLAKGIMGLTAKPYGKIKSGKILYEGKNLLEMDKKQLRRIRGEHISMIFQDPMTSLNPVMTVGDQIAEAIRNHDKLSRRDAAKKAAEILELVGIPSSRGSEYPHQFSGGMKQRVVIAIALACNPKILIADEPTTALDVTIQAQILEMIRDLRERFRTSMLLITHDLGVVAKMADRIAVMYAGKVVEYGDARQIFYNPCHPYTWGLLGAMPNLIQEVKSELYAIPGTPPDLYAPPKGCAFAARCPYAMGACLKADPPEYTCSDGHISRCWLMDKRAKEVTPPDGVPTLPRGGKEHE